MANDNSNELIFQSVGGLFPHTHKLVVKKGDIDNPSASGLILETSEEYSLVYKHKHQVKITADELARVKKGETVEVKDTDKGRHRFTIRLS